MTTTPTLPLRRERTSLLVALLVVSAISWVLIAGEADRMDEHMGGMDIADQLRMDAGLAAFVGLWALMMAAMMLPAAAPMILTFDRVQKSRRAKGSDAVPTALFVGVYLAVWVVAGIVAFLLATGMGAAADELDLGESGFGRFAGALMALAGVYQLTPLKRRCLTKCRGPMDYVLGAWRDGVGGAIRMGAGHAGYCVGCCWVLFVLLLPLGVMNLAIMGIATAVIFVEKATVIGHRFSRWLGVALIAGGLFVLVAPTSIPTAADFDEPAMVMTEEDMGGGGMTEDDMTEDDMTEDMTEDMGGTGGTSGTGGEMDPDMGGMGG